MYGLMAEFDTPEALLSATKRAFQAGFRKMDAYAPFPVEGLAEALGSENTRVPLIVFIGGLIGCIGGFYLQYWISTVDYPVIIGGRPLNSWPSFIPVTFELTVLIAALSAFFGLLALNRMPMPYHPVFNVDRFELASRNRFFLCIEADDPNFNATETKRFLDGLGSEAVYEVEP
jgi:hypothetical protein